MKSLFQAETFEEIKKRIEQLQPNSQRLWGKMEVAQMLAHCSATMEVAVGDKNPPRMFIGRILGPFVKSAFTNDKPFKKNTPTDKSFLVIDQRNFEKEKLIKRDKRNIIFRNVDGLEDIICDYKTD